MNFKKKKLLSTRQRNERSGQKLGSDLLATSLRYDVISHQQELAENRDLVEKYHQEAQIVLDVMKRTVSGKSYKAEDKLYIDEPVLPQLELGQPTIYASNVLPSEREQEVAEQQDTVQDHRFLPESSIKRAATRADLPSRTDSSRGRPTDSLRRGWSLLD